jgi:hypothetical protein
MKRPPLWMRMRIHNRDTKFGLWLPLFLLIPIALVVLIILSPLILVAIIVLWPFGWGRTALLLIPAAWRVYCSMTGLRVEVQGRNETVYLTVV